MILTCYIFNYKAFYAFYIHSTSHVKIQYFSLKSTADCDRLKIQAGNHSKILDHLNRCAVSHPESICIKAEYDLCLCELLA